VLIEHQATEMAQMGKRFNYMKNTLSIALTILTLTVYGQDKYNYVQFNKLIEVVGTEYVIAHIEDRGKMFKTINRYLLFIIY